MTSWQLVLFLAGATLPSFVIALIATAILRRLAPRWGLIDKPAARKVHATATPLGGGIAIWLAIALPLVAGLILVALVEQGILPDTVVPEFAAPHLPGVWQQS